MAGTHTITASYGGDALFLESSDSMLQTVTGTGTSTSTATSLSSSSDPSVFGQSVTFTATVSGTLITPTGTVTFKDGGTLIGTGAVTGAAGTGTATFTTSTLTVATHTLTAAYSGDLSYSASTSGPVNQTVNQAGTTTTVSSSKNPSVFGQSVTFTATVAVVSPGSGTPTGTVTFLEDGASLGTATLDGSGTSTLTTSSLHLNFTKITVVY